MTAPTEQQRPQLLLRSWQAAPAVVGLARDTLAYQAWKIGLGGQLTGRMVAVTSELVTNAVQASKPDALVKLKLQADRESIVVSVWDGSPEKPVFQQVDLSLEQIDAHPIEGFEFGGWGLSRIVATFADELGATWVKPEPLSGKWVYALFLIGA